MFLFTILSLYCLQIMILSILPKSEFEENTIIALFLFQYIPKLYRLLPLIAGQSPTGFIFESAWSNFIINLLTFILAGHAVGSFWYLAGLQVSTTICNVFTTPSGFCRFFSCLYCSFQRVKKCLLQAGNFTMDERRYIIDCTSGDTNLRALWRDSESVNACFQEDGFSLGIYLKAANLTTEPNIFTRFSFSLFWGFQVVLLIVIKTI